MPHKDKAGAVHKEKPTVRRRAASSKGDKLIDEQQETQKSCEEPVCACTEGTDDKQTTETGSHDCAACEQVCENEEQSLTDGLEDFVLEHDEVEPANLDGQREPQQTWPSRIYDKPVENLSARELGEEAERIAAAYLRRRGYEIIETNWRCSFGEVDIIAKDGDTYVLVEVKSRLSLNKSADIMPELSVGRHKMNVYNRLALMYIAYHLSVETLRFDVIAINIISENCAKLRHLVGAFTWDNPC